MGCETAAVSASAVATMRDALFMLLLPEKSGG
jgi:hypothetical protein